MAETKEEEKQNTNATNDSREGVWVRIPPTREMAVTSVDPYIPDSVTSDIPGRGYELRAERTVASDCTSG